MGRKKISINRITNKRLRQVRAHHALKLIGHIQQKEEGSPEKGDGTVFADGRIDLPDYL